MPTSTKSLVSPFVGTSSQQQIAASRALPAITAPKTTLIQTGNGQFVQKSTFTVPANGNYPLNASGDFIMVLPTSDSSDSAIDIASINPVGQPEFKVMGGVRTRVQYETAFRELQIRNLMATAKTFEVITGFGNVEVFDGELVKFRQTNQVKTVSTTDPLPVQILASTTAGMITPNQYSGTKTVAAINTPEALVIGASPFFAAKIQALVTNTDLIRYGFIAGNGNQFIELAPGQIDTIQMAPGFQWSFASVWIDVNVAGEGANYAGFGL